MSYSRLKIGILNYKNLFYSLIGLIVDYRGFALAYYIIGVGIFFSGLILTIILCYNKIERKKKTTKTSKETLSLNV